MTRPFPQPPARYAPARRPPTQPQTLRRLFPTVDNRQRVHLVESSLHLLRTSSAPSLHLLRMQTMSSVCADCVASLAVELFTSQAKNQDRKPSAQWKSGPVVVVVVVATAIVVVFYGQRLARIKSKNVSSFLCLPAKCKLAIKKPLSWSFLSLGCKVYNIYWFYLYHLIFHSIELLYLFIFNSFFYNLRLFSWRHLRLILYS